MLKYIVNGFSPKMLGRRVGGHLIKIQDITRREFEANKKDCVSAIGHHTLAEELGIPRNRFNIRIEKGDTVYIVQGADGRGHAMDTPKQDQLRFQKATIIY